MWTRIINGAADVVSSTSINIMCITRSIKGRMNACVLCMSIESTCAKPDCDRWIRGLKSKQITYFVKYWTLWVPAKHQIMQILNIYVLWWASERSKSEQHIYVRNLQGQYFGGLQMDFECDPINFTKEWRTSKTV